MFSVEKEWDSLNSEVLVEVPDKQKREVKIGFYTGVAAAMGMMHQIGSSDMTQDEGAAICQAIVAEAEQFFKDLVEDKK